VPPKQPRLAGYDAKNAKVFSAIGRENLEKPGINAEIQAWRDSVKQQGIASLEYRVNRLDLLEQKYFDLIDARSEEHADIPGGETGLLVKQVKLSPSGVEVEEYVADTAVTKEIRAIYDDAAKEMGHRVVKSESKLSGTEDFIAALRAFGGNGDS
jgi:hypothetical protein